MNTVKFVKYCLTVLSLTLFLPATAFAYDESWFKTDYWSGEYPQGFTLTDNVTTLIRVIPDPNAVQNIECSMEKGATYHPWNHDRVISSNLEFLSYVPKEIFVVTKSETLTLQIDQTDAEQAIRFNKGDEWTFLTYYAEGLFKMSFRGVEYTGHQDLVEISQEKNTGPASQNRITDEWMKMICANGVSGWLLLRDVIDQPSFDSANIIEYGNAKDK